MTAEVREERKLIEDEEDYLTCGRCQSEFPLERITTFIEHKKQECDGPLDDVLNKSRESGLQCVSCPKAFMTAVGMLKHVQFSHNLRLFLEKGAFAKGIQSTRFPSSLQPLPMSTSAPNQHSSEKWISPNRNNLLERLTTTQTSTMSLVYPQGSICTPADNPLDPNSTQLSDVTKANPAVTHAWNSSPKRQANQSLKQSGNKALHSALKQSLNFSINQKSASLQDQSTGMNQTQKSASLKTQSTAVNQLQKPPAPQTQPNGMNQSQISTSPHTQSTSVHQKPPALQTQLSGMNQSQISTSPHTQSTSVHQKPPALQTHVNGTNQPRVSTSPQTPSTGVNQLQQSSALQTHVNDMNQPQVTTSPLTQSTGVNQLQKPPAPQTHVNGMNQSQVSTLLPKPSTGVDLSQISKSLPTPSTGMDLSQQSPALQTQVNGMNHTQVSTSLETQTSGVNLAQNSKLLLIPSTGMDLPQTSKSPQKPSTGVDMSQTSALQQQSTGKTKTPRTTSPQTQTSFINQSQDSTSLQTQSQSSVSGISQKTDSRQSTTKQPVLFPVTSQSSTSLPKINIPVHLLNSDGSTPSDKSVLVGQDVGVGKIVPIVLLSGQMVDMAAKGCTPVQSSHLSGITTQSPVSIQTTNVPNTAAAQSKVNCPSKQISSISPQANFRTQQLNAKSPVSGIDKQKSQSINPHHSDNIPEMMEVAIDASVGTQNMTKIRPEIQETNQLVEKDVSLIGESLVVTLTDPTENVNSDVIMAYSSTDNRPSSSSQLTCGGQTTVQQAHDHGCSINSSQQLKGDIVTAADNNQTIMDSCSQTEKAVKREPEDLENSSNEACCKQPSCGVTVIPGTHESPRKCCSSVLPKKRKRHMETKHMSYLWSRYNRRRLYGGLDKTRSGGTIYIDVEDVHDDIPRSQVSTHNQQDSILQMSGDKESCKLDTNASSSVTSRGSVILQPGATFSIPLPYNTLPSGSRPRTSIIPITGVQRKLSTMLSHPIDSPSQSLVQDKDPESPTELPEGAVPTVAFTEISGMSNPDSGSEISLDPNCAFYQGRKRRYPTSRPFKCDQCDNAFNQRIHLKKHMSKHTGIKPYKCQQCDYSTVERSHLKVHIRIHTGEKPFKCTYCEYATAQNSTLKIHLKRHHGSQLLECPTCAKSFTHPDMYQVHQQEHLTDELTDSNSSQGQNIGPGHLQSGLALDNPKEEVSGSSETATMTVVTKEQAVWPD